LPDPHLPGVHRLVIPLPFAMNSLNAWLVDSGDGWILIDTGMHTAAGWRALDRAYAASGASWRDLRTLVITHMHPDHVGLAPEVKKASAASIGMHGLDSDLLREFTNPDQAEYWNGVALDLAGSPGDLKGPVNAAFHLLTVKFPDVNPEIVLEGGEKIGSLEVIWTPGHSPGHVCLYDAERRILFSGDHILDTTSPNIGWLPEGDPLGDYLTSLRHLRSRDIDIVLPGHGEPIRDHRGWIDRALQHHADRCERITEIVAENPRTAHEISLVLWMRDLDPIHYRFAIFEVLAHCVHLERRGVIRHEGTLWRP
jgi:glyoxylase-like metal-dependent hydrolase (beta-lactamase superfamily II)